MIPDPFYRGKVRDLYDAGEDMILVASDRISAFDVVFPDPVTDKGKILTGVSTRWFRHFRKQPTLSFPNDPRPLEQILDFDDHLITDRIEEFPEPYRNHEPFRDRAVLARKVKRIDFECVVRGFIAGSGWKDYQQTGAICGHALPTGLRQGDRLPTPIFTPATKEDLGKHDQNVSVSFMKEKLGVDLADGLERISLALFREATLLLESVGILLCDTKFEFGLSGDRIVLIDEALTPDSSRFWDQARYVPGEAAPGFDKQYIRDYLETTGWDKTPPPPPLPAEVIDRTVVLYREIERRLTGILK